MKTTGDNLFRETLKYYKARRQEIDSRRRLIDNHSDWSMLEAFVQKCNDNPNLKVEIQLKDGTKIIMKTSEERKRHDFEEINGVTYTES
ncbi:Uncharacterised protein [uncultured archaeon]|nr:Uncharacterised protein [uncultured archaeon]